MFCLCSDSIFRHERASALYDPVGRQPGKYPGDTRQDIELPARQGCLPGNHPRAAAGYYLAVEPGHADCKVGSARISVEISIIPERPIYCPLQPQVQNCKIRMAASRQNTRFANNTASQSPRDAIPYLLIILFIPARSSGKRMAYPEPPNSKSSVRRAGQAISSGVATPQDLELVDQWRAAHGYVINTFQAWLKGHIGKQSFYIEFAQRLKRRNTVIDKLKRKNHEGEFLITDVSSMHDFAGCRMIFNNISQLDKFRTYIHSSSTMRNVEHQLRHSPDKYNYIERPKPTGYRGIHDVYRHFPRGSVRRQEKKPWDGLLVEVQYRTRAQHAWATAVEISDLLDGERTKFELDSSVRGRFFSIASEIIARRHEGLKRAYTEISTVELVSILQQLENELGILRRLELLRQFEDEASLQTHNVLNIYRKPDGSLELEVLPFKSAAPAIEKASLLEASSTSINAVYVRSDNPKQLRSAYRNYFYDPVDFVDIIRFEGDLKTD